MAFVNKYLLLKKILLDYKQTPRYQAVIAVNIGGIFLSRYDNSLIVKLISHIVYQLMD